MENSVITQKNHAKRPLKEMAHFLHIKYMKIFSGGE
jgi:hypothetical protein